MDLPIGFDLPQPLYALTVSQPWPRMFLLEENPKKIENRMWRPEELQHGDWFALHGGRQPKSVKEFDECTAAMDWINLHVWGSEGDPEDWAYREDILEASVTGLFALAQYRGATTSRGQMWRTQDRFGWLIGNMLPFPKPVQCRGNRDLWPVEGTVLNAVRQQLRLSGLAIQAVQEPPTSPPQSGGGLKITLPLKVFCPGIPVRILPDHPEHKRMYGLPAGDDWITVICERSKEGSEWYS